MGNETKYIQQTIQNGHISGDGEFTYKCQKYLEDALRIPKSLLTTSCTHALEMSALLLNLQPGDEVILPAFTFVSTVNAFVLRGAHPVFADVCPDTLNIDASQLPQLITPRTKAIIPVHYGGVGCEMDAILEIAHQHALAIVEDNAHGLFGKYKGMYLGTFGALATQSFHETKNFSCGEGGALLINTPEYIERAEMIREKGTNRSRFFRGEVDKYTWVEIGSSYLPSDILAAHLFAQLETRKKIQARRQQIWETYHTALQDLESVGIQRPYVPAYCEQSYHLYYVLLPSLEIRQALIAYLKVNAITSVFHYQPLHLSKMGLHFGGQVGDCPITEDISDRLLRLPFYYGLTPKDQAFVIQKIYDFFKRRNA